MKKALKISALVLIVLMAVAFAIPFIVKRFVDEKFCAFFAFRLFRLLCLFWRGFFLSDEFRSEGLELFLLWQPGYCEYRVEAPDDVGQAGYQQEGCVADPAEEAGEPFADHIANGPAPGEAKAGSDEGCRHGEEDESGDDIPEVAADGKDLPGEEQVDADDEEDGAKEIGGEAESFEEEFVGDQGAEVAEEIADLHVGGGQQDGGAMLEYLVLVFFPGEEIGGKGDEQEEGNQQANGPGDLVGTFVFDELSDLDWRLLIRFELFRRFLVLL